LHILGRFRRKYPGIHVAVRAGNTETVIASLYSYEADIGVLGEVPAGRDFEVVRLNSTPVVAFVSIGHPLARAGSLSVEELAQLPLVMRERGSRTRAKLEELAAAHGLELKPAIEAEGREAVREIVASGAGVGFVSAAEFGHDARLVQIPIAAPQMLMDEALICLRERSGGKLVRAFLDIAGSMAVR
jgi:DNA-binding transcriptional LysR family regulator